MSFDPKHEEQLEALEVQLRRAPALTPELISNVVVNASARLPDRIDRLIEAGAWNDAALALVELELPPWKLRRLVYENGEWLCSLSKQPNLPVDLDDTASASHGVLALAILSAFVEAERRMCATREITLRTVPQVRPTSGRAICCDNFG